MSGNQHTTEQCYFVLTSGVPAGAAKTAREGPGCPAVTVVAVSCKQNENTYCYNMPVSSRRNGGKFDDPNAARYRGIVKIIDLILS